MHKVALPSACFGSLVIFHRFHLLSSLPPSHSVPLCPQPTLEVSLLLISFLKACGHTATYTYPIMKPVYLCIYPQFSLDEETLSKRFSTLLVLVIHYMCTCNRTDTIIFMSCLVLLCGVYFLLAIAASYQLEFKLMTCCMARRHARSS